MTAAADTPDTVQGPTVVARLVPARWTPPATCSTSWRRSSTPSEAVVSAYDGSGGWTVAIHFNDPPNETAVRALVGARGRAGGGQCAGVRDASRRRTG